MRLRKPLLIGLVLVCTGAAARATRAQAGPPLLTDDPETPGKNHWEINLAAFVSQTPTKRLIGAPLLDANYGWGERLQLKAEVPWLVLQDRAGGPTRTGSGSMNVGVKWRFIDQDQHGFSMSVYPQLEFRTASSSVRKGLIEGGAELRLPVEVSRDFGTFAIDGELGYQVVQRDRDEWIYGIAVAREVNKRMQLLAEIHGESKRNVSENFVLLNLGGRYNFSKRYTLLFSAGRSLHTVGDQPTWVAYTGLQLHF